MTIYDLKPRFQQRLRPICRGLAGRSVTANQVTLAAMFLSLVAGGAVWLWPDQPATLVAIPVVLFVRMALNAIDGMLAREHGMKSPLGGFLNELTDVLSDAALYAPLARVAGVPPLLIFLAVFLAALTEMAGVVAVQIGASRRYDGPLGKSDRAFVFGAMYLFIGCGVPHHDRWSFALLAVVNLLLAATILNRMQAGLREVREKAP